MLQQQYADLLKKREEIMKEQKQLREKSRVYPFTERYKNLSRYFSGM
jgi:hypothetical protein